MTGSQLNVRGYEILQREVRFLERRYNLKEQTSTESEEVRRK